MLHAHVCMSVLYRCVPSDSIIFHETNVQLSEGFGLPHWMPWRQMHGSAWRKRKGVLRRLFEPGAGSLGPMGVFVAWQNPWKSAISCKTKPDWLLTHPQPTRVKLLESFPQQTLTDRVQPRSERLIGPL